MKIIKSTGEVMKFETSGKKPSLEEMQKVVGGFIEIINLPKDVIMIINEEGLCMDLPLNNMASTIVSSQFNEECIIVGDVLIGTSEEVN